MEKYDLIIVGAGPAGIFTAVELLRRGSKKHILLVEKGKPVEKRHCPKAEIGHCVNCRPTCAITTGFSGAGAFSDGKLGTGTHDSRISWVLARLIDHGAKASIAYDAKPHLGTDVLSKVVVSIREEIEALGGEVRFRTRLDGLDIRDSALRGLTVTSGGVSERIAAEALILATGHSARDTFKMLLEAGLPLEPKAFSMGARIEHLQADIDLAQYGMPRGKKLPAADYGLNVHLPDGRGIYTFCMCPGGYVVAAASEEGGVVTNGMSNYARDGRNANAALLVNVTPEDLPNDDPLAGIELQRACEAAAYRLGGSNWNAPAQLVGDFLAGRASKAPGKVKPTYPLGVTWTAIDEALPQHIAESLRLGLPLLGKKLRGYDRPDAVLTGVETRSSSPVTVTRDRTCHAVSTPGLYPCGEGAGYAGGIMSAATDGIRCAEALIADL